MYKLLIADDEYEIRNGLFKYFPWNEVGFEVVGQVANGKQAIDYIHGHPVDIILCDIVMPGLTGLELAEYLQRKHPEIKVCFYTAYKDFDYAQKAVSLNAVYYVLKSSTSADLINVFRNIKHSMDERKHGEKAVSVPETISRGPESNGPVRNDPMDGAFRPGSNEQEDLLIQNIRQYIHEHYATANLEDIAHSIYMSPNYISKIFKERTKQNLSDFLLQVRMENAARQLFDLRNKIYEVSEKVGYKYVKNFSRAFRDYFGVSPREYRRGKPLQHSKQ